MLRQEQLKLIEKRNKIEHSLDPMRMLEQEDSSFRIVKVVPANAFSLETETAKVQNLVRTAPKGK